MRLLAFICAFIGASLVFAGLASADGARGRFAGSGGSASTEPFVALAPLSLYDDGGTVAVSSTAAGAGVSGYLTNVGGQFQLDAGLIAIGGGYLGGDRHFGAFFPGVTLAAGDVIAESRFTAPATFTRLTTRIHTAGSDGAHTFTVDVYDLTTSTVVCVTGAITCNTAASSVGVACSSSVAALDDVQLRVNDASCSTTAPIMGIEAEYR